MLPAKKVKTKDSKYEEFQKRFGEMNDKQLLEAAISQSNNPGWVSSRGYYMVALRQEFIKRGLSFPNANTPKPLGDDPRVGDKDLVPRDAAIIEQTLDALGITARIAEINYRPKDTEFCLEIALGTPLESITKLNKDIALALASPTGDVEIEAPIPGRALVAIRMPYDKQWYETRIKAFELRQENEKNNPTPAETTDKTKKTEFPVTLRDYLAVVFYIIAGIFDITTEYLRKLGNFIEGRERQF